jgi:hypothetical protein
MIQNRRRWIRSTVGVGAALWLHRQSRANGFVSANERPRVAAVGTGSRWCQKATGIDGPYGAAPDFRRFGDYVAVSDVDSQRMGRAAAIVKEWTGVEPISDVFSHHRALSTCHLAGIAARLNREIRRDPVASIFIAPTSRTPIEESTSGTRGR